MINPEISDRTTGFLALLLILLIVYLLKPVYGSSKTLRSPCEETSYIQIEGDISSPGVYAFCRKASLRELIRRAGGLRFDPAPSETSGGFTFSSGTKVLVWRDGEECNFSQNEMTAFYKFSLGIPISMNRESEEGLSALPGIGAGLARAIVRERSKRGGFRSLIEIISIDGISHKLYMKIRPYLIL